MKKQPPESSKLILHPHPTVSKMFMPKAASETLSHQVRDFIPSQPQHARHLSPVLAPSQMELTRENVSKSPVS